jgi:nucleoside-diphosphate-sugar epimerase
MAQPGFRPGCVIGSATAASLGAVGRRCGWGVGVVLAACQAVVHAASVYSFDSRDARRIRQVNVRGTDLMLGTAHRAGLDPIVYVSSIVGLLPPNGQTLTPDSPATHPAPTLGPRPRRNGSPAVTRRPARRW